MVENNWYDYEGPITVEENTEIIARVEDEDGQTGEEQRIEISNIDKKNSRNRSTKSNEYNKQHRSNM